MALKYKKYIWLVSRDILLDGYLIGYNKSILFKKKISHKQNLELKSSVVLYWEYVNISVVFLFEFRSFRIRRWYVCKYQMFVLIDFYLLYIPGNYNRIVGGRKTTIDKQPYQVALYSILNTENILCGGSIIGPTWILTAGHCCESLVYIINP